ncbi:MAG: type I restriction endonuclease [Rickettsiales bacterium]|nr:type I restriction endonuclease [Rickettsiales bacterium]
MNETELENLCLDWFRECGWDVAHGPDIAPDSRSPLRRDYAQVVLESHVQTAFARINPHLPLECLEQVLVAVSKPESPDLVASNRAFHRMLLEGVPVQYKIDDEIKHDHALLMDFDTQSNNSFYAVNQFTITGTRQPRRPDIICFINGLPIAVLELKSPADENADIWDAYHQIQTYKDEISDLFICNEALVISDGYTARVGSLTAARERFMPWRTIKDEDDKPVVEWELETMVRGFFDPAMLLDYIRFFVLFENDDAAIIKKIAGYHQFHAVREAVNATVVASVGAHKDLRSDIKPNSKKAGVVWHTQGSGKSISMCCYAGMLLQQKEMNNPTLLVVSTNRQNFECL